MKVFFFWEKGAILEYVTDPRVLFPVRSVTMVGNPQNDSAS